MTERARPTPDLLQSLHDAKREFHARQRALPPHEKFRHFLALQRIDYELRLARGEELRWWERPWDVDP